MIVERSGQFLADRKIHLGDGNFKPVVNKSTY